MLKRLIEVALPLKEVSEQSAREKSIRHGHISTLHIWWARRPLAACRAAVFASLIPDPDDPECPESFRSLVGELLDRDELIPKNGDGSAIADTPRNRCLEFIKHLVKWENTNNPKYIDPARALIAAAHKVLCPEPRNEAPVVLDPFAGGGTIPLEALRLGCEGHAIDLNPVAHLIELCTLVYPQKFGQPSSRAVPQYITQLIAHNRKKDLEEGRPLFNANKSKGSHASTNDEIIPAIDVTESEYRSNPLAADVKYWGHWVLEKARREVGKYYHAEKGKGVPVAFLWARTLKCPNPQCGIEIPLLQTKLVFTDKEAATVLHIGEKRGGLHITHRLVAKPSEDDIAGTLGRNSAICPHCNVAIHKSDLEHIGKKGFGQVLTAVIEELGDDKKCRCPSESDLSLYRSAETALAALLSCSKPEDVCVPDAELPYLRSIFNVHVYGLDNWAKLFTPRQLITLSCLARCVRDAVAMHSDQDDSDYYRAVAGYLLLALGRQADYGSTLCLWSPEGGFLAHTFGRQALAMIWDYAEGNPFGSMTGNWSGGLDWICRVIVNLSATPMKPGSVIRGDATRTAISDGAVDCILTDPPYYDAIPYANLSDFFYVWFRPVAKWMPTVFGTPLAPKGPEIVQLAERNVAYKHKTKEFFETGMQRAFAEGRRILASHGLYTVVYAHKTTAAWETLVAALITEGLVVTSSWPLHTERPGRLRAHSSAALASSVFLVCRRRDSILGQGLWDDVRKELRTVARERLEFFWSQGIRGADFFISAIGPALSVFGKYEKVTKLSGEEVTVGQFLDEVRSLVSNYALGKIMKTGQTASIDPESRFYVVWKWSYGDTKVPADESFKLSQALGMPTETIWDRTGVLEKAGENVQTMPITKRMKIKDLGEPYANGSPGSIIDVLHRLCAFREKNDTDGMAQFLVRSGQGNNPSLWLLAQAISEILPDGDKEKQLMQGLLNQKEKLEQAAGQGRLF